MAKRRFEVDFRGWAIIELDDAVIDAVDDEWRDYLYKLFTPEQIAQHIAYNLVIRHAKLSHLDGWADQPNENARIVDEEDWDIEALEIPVK